MTTVQPMQEPADLLARYVEGPDWLHMAVAGLSNAQLDSAQKPDTWTIRQIAHHIVDGDDLWKMVLKAALGNSDAIIGLPWYWDKPQDEWAHRWNYAGRALEPSLALFQANRRHVQQLIESIPNAWASSICVAWSGRDPERITVGDIIRMQERHTRGHIAEIEAIRQGLE